MAASEGERPGNWIAVVGRLRVRLVLVGVDMGLGVVGAELDAGTLPRELKGEPRGEPRGEFTGVELTGGLR